MTKSKSYPDRMREQTHLVNLSLRDAVVLALRANLDIRIESYARDLTDMTLQSELGSYDPVLGFQSSLSGQSTPSVSVLQSGDDLSVQTSHGLVFGPTYLESLPGGGQVGLTFTAGRNTTNNAYTFLNPSYNANLSFSLTQPLWRGAFSQDPVAHQIRLIRLTQKINDSQFHQTVSGIIQQVEVQYWTLLQALQIHETERQSRDLAVIQYENTVQKVAAGILAHVAIASDKAEIASRDQQTIAAELQIVSSENALKALLTPKADAPLWKDVIIPTDEPVVEEPGVGLDEAVRIALASRPEVEQLQLSLAQNANDRRFYRNAERPAINLQATGSSVGQSGFLIGGYVLPITDGSISSSSAGVGGLSNAIGQTLNIRYPSWTVGINAQYTLFNRTARAELAGAEVTKRQLDAQLENARQAIVTQTRNAWETLVVQRKNWDSAKLATQYSREQLEGETARFQAGFTTNFEVLRYQRDLANAQLQELQAQTNYRIALANLRAAMDRLVDAHDIAISRSH